MIGGPYTITHTINVGGGTAFKVTNNDMDDGVPSWGSR
jgi:hypothetical protein